MSKQIVVEKSARADILKTFEVSRKCLWQALTYGSNGPQAKKLRAAALARRGVIVNFELGTTENPSFDTYFSEAPHQMIQVFSERVRVVCDLECIGDVVIEVDGEEVESFGTIPMSQLPQVQSRAREVVNNLR